MQPVRDCLSTVILACWATVDLSWSIKQWKWCVGTAVNFWRYRQEMVHRLHPESWHVRKKPPPLGFVWQLHAWFTVLDLSGNCTCGSLSWICLAIAHVVDCLGFVWQLHMWLTVWQTRVITWRASGAGDAVFIFWRNAIEPFDPSDQKSKGHQGLWLGHRETMFQLDTDTFMTHAWQKTRGKIPKTRKVC